ncbi:hypothetical protein DFQ29_007923 [Apophysomyces sp. BC1021]|nr:hypothetical protein DFQ29_007923 [Apophysomyces sp. BC1021]
MTLSGVIMFDSSTIDNTTQQQQQHKYQQRQISLPFIVVNRSTGYTLLTSLYLATQMALEGHQGMFSEATIHRTDDVPARSSGQWYFVAPWFINCIAATFLVYIASYAFRHFRQRRRQHALDQQQSNSQSDQTPTTDHATASHPTIANFRREQNQRGPWGIGWQQLQQFPLMEYDPLQEVISVTSASQVRTWILCSLYRSLAQSQIEVLPAMQT